MARSRTPQLTPAQVKYIMANLDENYGPRIVVISIVLITVCTIVLPLRFIARKVRNLPWQIDDYSTIPAWVGPPPRFPYCSA